nr:MAG TPA: Putative transferase, nesg, ydcK, Structural Genomics.38A [Caudoviricetes sp.]
MDKKYELLENDRKKLLGGQTVYRIRALRDFGNVKAGDLGGYIAGEHNLSHDGTCWVYDEATVCSNARIVEEAKVKHHAKIGGNAQLRHFAKAKDRAQVYGNVVMYARSVVKGFAELGDRVNLFDNSVVRGRAKLFNRVKVYGSVVISGDIAIGTGTFKGNTRIKSERDFIVFYNAPFNDYEMTIYVGESEIELCFGWEHFTLNDFIAYSHRRFHEDLYNEVMALIQAARLRLDKRQAVKLLEE